MFFLTRKFSLVCPALSVYLILWKICFLEVCDISKQEYGTILTQVKTIECNKKLKKGWAIKEGKIELVPGEKLSREEDQRLVLWIFKILVLNQSSTANIRH